MMMSAEQMTLMKRLQITDFVLLETQLFLDTHPHDSMALDYYKKYAKMHVDTMMEYTQKFGPVMLPTDKEMRNWEWVEGPWPWEKGMED